MAKLSVYVETTVVSYLVARKNADALTATRMEITRRWWTTRDDYDLIVSPEVLREIARGDASYAQDRLDVLNGLPALALNPAVIEIAGALLAAKIFPAKAQPDALHLAFASAYAIDVLLTWNLKHLANPVAMKRAREVVTMFAAAMPEICTPEQLLASGD